MHAMESFALAKAAARNPRNRSPSRTVACGGFYKVNLPGGEHVATDQVLYNLARRGIEWDLLFWCHSRRIPIMAYSPIEQGRLLRHPTLLAVAKRHGATPAQIALAWVLRHEYMIAIPKAGTPRHVEENYGALNIQLTHEDLDDLNRAFPPAEPQPLEML